MPHPSSLIPHPSVLDGVASLVAKSLLRQEDGPTGEPRFVMLETIREFALEWLAASGEENDRRHRHARFFLRLAERCEAASYLPHGERLLAALDADHPNLRAALAWFEGEGNVDDLIRLGAALHLFWIVRGDLHEARTGLERAVALGRAARSPVLAKGLIALASAVHFQGDEALALALCEEGLALTRALPDPWALFRGLTIRGLIALRLGDLARAAAVQTESLAMLDALHDSDWAPRAASTVLGHLGNIAVARGDVAAAETHFAAALDRQRALSCAPGTSHVIANHPVAGLGDVARARGDHAAALAAYQNGLRLAWGVHDTRATAYALGGVAATLAAAGRWEPAARLFGAVEAMHERTGLPFDLETMDRQRALGLPEPWQRADEPFGAGQPLRDALGDRSAATVSRVPDPVAPARHWAEGRRLPLEEAVAAATAARLGREATDNGEPDHRAGLTARELEVLRLLAEGRSDPEIAAALSVSRRTAATHVRHIFDKLDVGSRAAAAAYAVRHGLA